MRVGWLSHQFAADREMPKRPGLLPGRFAGGAEMSTEEMIAADHPWADMPYEVCPAPLDVDAIPQGVPKEDFVLWAGRDIGHKGRDQARAFVAEKGLRLVELTDVPRETVLEHMGRARWFVHMPQGFVDPCPRTVIEAEIAGCEVWVNDRVGRVPVRGAAEVAEYIRRVPGRFWSWVLT